MKSVLGLLALLFLSAPVVAAEPLVVYTEDFPPYNVPDGHGGVAGLSTERVRKVLDRAGLVYEIKLVPWSRAVKLATTEKNVLIYTLARTPKRAPAFDWLVPLVRSQYYLFQRPDDPRTVTAEALKAGQFRAVCVTANISCELLAVLGVPQDKLIRLPNEGFLDLPVVLAGRADIYFNDRVGNAAQLREAGLPKTAIKEAMAVDYDGGFYLAAGLQVPAEVRTQVRAAYEALKREGHFAPVDRIDPTTPPCPNADKPVNQLLKRGS